MIRFIICGWHMNQDTVLNGFNTLQEYNPDSVHVFGLVIKNLQIL